MCIFTIAGILPKAVLRHTLSKRCPAMCEIEMIGEKKGITSKLTNAWLTLMKMGSEQGR